MNKVMGGPISGQTIEWQVADGRRRYTKCISKWDSAGTHKHVTNLVTNQDIINIGSIGDRMNGMHALLGESQCYIKVKKHLFADKAF